MVKTILILPDGSELSSGTEAANAIEHVTIKECVNESRELTLGSVCAAMLEVTIIAPGGGLSIGAGAEVAVFRQDAAGIRHPMGIFITEEPTRPSANRLKLIGYDRVTRLDRDLTNWLLGLTGWPYTLLDFSRLVCAACGLTLKNETIPNGDFPVEKFSAQGITGRQLLRWAGQLAGQFCRAEADGSLAFSWYRENGSVSIGPGSGADTLWYFGDSLKFEDYQVAPISQVVLRHSDQDVGVAWPDTATENACVISGNYLLSAQSEDALLPVARTLYEGLQGAVYTPCRVSVPADFRIRAGDILPVTDGNGKQLRLYVMTRTQSGQRDTLECTGSRDRSCAGAVYNQSYQALSGRMLEISKSVDGLQIRARELEQQNQDLQVTVSSQITQNAREVELSFSRVQQQVDANTAGREELSNYINFSQEGIRLGAQGSTMTQQLTNAENVFRVSGQAVSGTDAHRHWARRLEGTQSGQLGNLEFKRRSNGNAVMRYKANG